jgi:hypothetical protein
MIFLRYILPSSIEKCWLVDAYILYENKTWMDCETKRTKERVKGRRRSIVWRCHDHKKATLALNLAHHESVCVCKQNSSVFAVVSRATKYLISEHFTRNMFILNNDNKSRMNKLASAQPDL